MINARPLKFKANPHAAKPHQDKGKPCRHGDFYACHACHSLSPSGARMTRLNQIFTAEASAFIVNLDRRQTMGLSQNVYRFVILRNEVTKDLSFEGFRKLSEKDSSLRSE
jgi:hypothetical protein